MKLKLQDIVKSLVINYEITDEEILETVKFLTQDNICHSTKMLKRIVKMLNEDLEYEDAPV